MAIASREDVLEGAGLPREDLDHLARMEPQLAPPQSTDQEAFERDTLAVTGFFAAGRTIMERLPTRPLRSAGEQAAANALNEYLRQVRVGFLRRHAGTLYGHLTNDLRDFVRVEDLVYLAAERVPGLAPSRAQVLA